MKLISVRRLSILTLAAAAFASAVFAQSGPDPFTFVVRTNQATNVLVTSEAKTLTGFSDPLAVSVSGAGNPQYKVGSGTYTSAPGTIVAGQTLTMRHTSASSASTETLSTVTVGSYSTSFKSVTGATDRTPDAFDFGVKNGTFPNTFVESDPRTLTGFNASVSIIPGNGAQYRIDGGAWTNASGSLLPGQVLQMRHLTSSGELAYTQTNLKVGGITGFFTTRNRSNTNQAPIADAGADQVVDENTTVTLDGSASADEEGALSYAWAQTGGPDVALTGADTATASFTAPDVTGDETLSFELTVTDDVGVSATDEVTVTVLPVPVLSISDGQGVESTGLVGFRVTFTPATTRGVIVDWDTTDGTARNPADFNGGHGQFAVPPGTSEALLYIQVKADDFDENDETFSIGLSNPSNATIGNGLATGTITDDDDKGLLQVGAAKRSITPTQAQIDGIVEPRAFGAGTHLQKFNLGGYGTDVGQNLPDPASEIPQQATSTEPASRRVYTNAAGAEEHTWIRLMAVEQPGGDTVVFVMIDAVGAGNLIQAGVKQAIVAAAAANGAAVLPENILFGQTHSHAGADLQGLWGGVPQDWVRNVLYMAAGDAAAEAFATRRPARLSFKQGHTSDFNNYRRPRIEPSADADGVVTLLSARADDGVAVGSVLQYNAHPTSITDDVRPRTPHADYILGAMEWLEGHDAGTALYFNGPIADASPSGGLPGCANNEPADGRKFGDVRCRGQGMADWLLQPGRAITERELAPTVSARSAQAVLPITNPAFLATAAAGSFNRYYNFAQLPTDQIPGLTPEQAADLPQVAPIAVTTVSRVTLGGAESGLEIVTVPGETTNTFGQYIRGLATSKVMLFGLTHNSFGYILPEEEFSHVAQDGDNGFLVPFTGYEENVSLGPLTAPLLRTQAYNVLFDRADRNVPPTLSSCLDGAYDGGCVLTVLENRLNLLVGSVVACVENGLGGAGCPFGNAGAPDEFPGTGPIDEPAVDLRLMFASADALSRGCDILDSSHCLLPFPSDHFTVAAAPGSPQSVERGGTGKRIDFNMLAMPRNGFGKPIDPTEWNRNDGFSPGQQIFAYIPNVATVKDAAGQPTGPIVGAPPITDIGRSLDIGGSSVVVLDALTGEPHPVWAEIDLNAGYLLPADKIDNPDPTKDARPALIVRPAKNFAEGRRYVVVLKNLKDDDTGAPILAGPAFTACRDRRATDLPAVQARCAALEAGVFPVLQAAGIPVAGNSGLYLAWDFTVASTENNVSRLRHMRDDAFVNYLGQTEAPDGSIVNLGRAPAFKVTQVSESNGERTVQGSFTIPSYVVPSDPSPLERERDVRQQLKEQFPQFAAAFDAFNSVPRQAYTVSAPPNRLFYNPADNPNPDDPFGQRYGDGLPDRTGEMTATFTCRFPRGASAATRPIVYGHGLLGGQEERGADHEYDMMYCKADWFGFAFGDIPNVVTVLTDVSNFPVIPDGSQQGMVNQLFLARLLRHPEGFIADPAFQRDGQPLFDNREVFYDGNSQGGILGGVVVAMSKDITRGVLGVVGMNYSTLLQRSVDYDGQLAIGIPPYSMPTYLGYQDDLDRQLVFSMMQMLWDRSENNGYAHHITNNAALKGPDKQVLLHPAFADHQVTMWSAHVMARTIGINLADMYQRLPGEGATYTFPTKFDFFAQRGPDEAEFWGMPLVGRDAGVAYDEAGCTSNCRTSRSALVEFDEGRTAIPPIGNVPPRADDFDPHGFPRGTIYGRCQKSHFLHTQGRLIDVRGERNVTSAATCPALPPAVDTAPVAATSEPGFLDALLAALGEAAERLSGGDVPGAVAALQGAGELVVAEVTQTIDGLTGGDDTGPEGIWLRGDLHVHDDHSADGSGSRQGLGQGAPGNVSLSDQITFAQTQRLDFLNFNDHRTFDQHYDPLWTSDALLLITGEEANGGPHANVFGALDMINQADNPAGAPQFRKLQQSIWDAHAQGAAWQTNHPDDGEVESENPDGTVTTNAYADAVGPDLCEIWNRGTRNSTKIAYCENRWNAGYRSGIAGASDNHFKELWAVAGPGTPLTHVLAAEKSTPALLDALRAGRTAINLNDRAPFVTLTGDFDGDGKFEAVGGDEVRLEPSRSATLRVSIDNGAGATVNVYRMPGKIAGAFKTFQSKSGPEHFDFTITGEAAKPQDWYRVEVRGVGEADAAAYQDPANPVDQDLPLRALTAPLFVSTGAFASPASPQLPADEGAPDGATLVFGDATDNAFAGFADVAVAGGVTHTVAEVRSGHANRIVYRARLVDGSLTPAFDLSPDSTLARQPAIAVLGSNLWVAFQDERSGELPHNPQIYVRHSHDGGATWDDEIQVSTSAARAQRPDIALLDAATPVVVWEDNDGGAFDVRARILGRDGAPVNLSTSGKTVIPGNAYDSRSAIYPASVSPKVAVRADGAIAVAWQDNRTDVDPGWTGHTESPDELAAEQPDRCATALQDAFGAFEPPDQNECVFSERGTETDDWEIFVATYAGSAWTAPANVSNAPFYADRHVTLAYDGLGDLYAAWDSKDKRSMAGPRLLVASARLNAGEWQGIGWVAYDGQYSSQRPVFGSDDGALSLFWMDGSSSDWRWRVRRAQYDGAQWQDFGFVTGPGNGTWPSYANGWLAFTSDRAATREQRKPHQVYLLPLAGVSLPPDTDGDGVPDAADQCPTEPGVPEQSGCPAADTDGDGVIDPIDVCPNDAGPASNDGCPLPPDADGDGVPDTSDQCPNTPSGTPVGANGCPVEPAGGFPLCGDTFVDGEHCISEIPVIGALIQDAVDTAYGAVMGGEDPGVPYNPAELVIDCTGPAGDFEPGTPEFERRDAENIYCTTERHQQLLQHPANNPYMMQNYGADPYRAPARNAGKRFRHADIDIPGVDGQVGTSFHFNADSNAEIYMPCAAGTCADLPAGLQTFEPPYPVAIVMHGAASDKKHLEWASQPLAEHGYFVLTANGTGNGLPDVLLAWLFDPANPYRDQLDLSRIGTTGHSLGAENSTRVQGDARVSGIVAWDPCDGSGGNECRNSKGSRLHDKGAAARTPTLFLTADYLGFPGYPQPQASVPGDLRVAGFEILRTNGVDTMLVTPRATTHLDWAGAFTFGNRLNEATSLYYTLSWFDRYVKGKLAVDGDGNVVTQQGRSEGEERAYRQAIADAAFAHLTAANFDGLVDLHNISQGYYDRLKAVESGDLEYGGNVPFTVRDLPLADRLSFYHRSVCFISQPDFAAGDGSQIAARADTGLDGDMRQTGCTVAQAPVDSDGDGVPDAQDAFPNDPAESADADLDGLGDNADSDDDNDGVVDSADACPTEAGTGADGCPEQPADSFPMCDPFFGTDYCARDLDNFVPGAGTLVQETANTVYDTLNGGGEPPPPAPGESLASCAVNQDPAACQAALESLADLQDCEFDESGINCAYEVAHDAIGVDTAANYLHGLFAQCATTPAAPACGAIRSVADGSDAASIPVLSRPVPRGDLVYAEVEDAEPSTKTVDGAIDDWMAQGTRIGGTDLHEFGEHVYSDFLFDAFGADIGDDAQRWAALSLAGEFSSRTERVDALQQAGGDQLDVPPPGGTTSDHYGDRANREDGTDLTEVRWAADGDDLYFLARVSRLQDPANLAVLILADTDGTSGMAGLNAGLTTAIFDRAIVLRAGGGELRNIAAGGAPVAIETAVSAAGYDNAVEARIPRALLERADGKIKVAVMTVRGAGADLVPANVAYRFNEPVTIFAERAQALSLFAGSVDHFARQIAVADLTGGRTQAARPGPGYHERQFVSGANISRESDTEEGRLQPYGVFVPTAVKVNTLNQARMTIWTHYRGGKAHSGAAWTPRLFWQLGEEQGNIVVSPRGRGTSTWYTTRSHQDFFEVFADVAGTGMLKQYAQENLPPDHEFTGQGLFFVDPARVYISGYSMGGFATYLFTGLYPDLFAAGFGQSGAVTQGAWTGIGPDPGQPGHDQTCGLVAPEDFPEVGGGSPCFIEANDGRANAQLNFRILENTRYVPISIHHGTNDELALTPGAARMGARLAELQYQYDATTFIGYEHFTQAIMDEWRDGAQYLNLHERPENPRAVTYKVVPALVEAVNEVQLKGWNDNQAFAFNPDGAYWVDGLVVRDAACEGECPRPGQDFASDKFGRIDAESGRLPGMTYVPVPRSGTDVDSDDPAAFAADPYVSTNVYSPANHSTPFVRHSLYWQKTGDVAGDANTFSATLVNLSAATLDLARMEQHFDEAIDGDVKSDGAATLTLANIGGDMTVCVNGTATGEVLAGGDAQVNLAGDASVRLVPGPGASCAGGGGPAPAESNLASCYTHPQHAQCPLKPLFELLSETQRNVCLTQGIDDAACPLSAVVKPLEDNDPSGAATTLAGILSDVLGCASRPAAPFCQFSADDCDIDPTGTACAVRDALETVYALNDQLGLPLTGPTAGDTPCDVPATEAEDGSPEFAQRDLMNIVCASQRLADQYANPDFHLALSVRGTPRTYLYNLLEQAADPTRPRVTAAQWIPGGRTTDPYRIDEDWAAAGRGRVTHISFVAESGARLVGNVFRPPASVPPPYPAIVITTGSIQGYQEMYNWAAEGLAEAGYLVLAYDVQGQGRSETFAHTPDGMPDPDGKGVPFQQPYNFEQGTRDALRWLLSSKAAPYIAATANSAGTELYNPHSSDVDRSALGLAGHSLGASAVSRVAQEQACDPGVPRLLRDGCVSAVVGWDSLSAPAGLALKAPGLSLTAEYFLNPTPASSAPDYESGMTAFNAFAAAGVDSMRVSLRHSTHLEWTYIPLILPASRYGERMSMHYTLAWFDRYVRDQAAATARLTATHFDDSADASSIGAGTFDPISGNNVPYKIAGRCVANYTSFYYRSAYRLEGGAEAEPDLRARGCN